MKRFTQDVDGTDVVCKQQHEPRVQCLALRKRQVLVRLNQRVLDWCCSSLSFQRVSASAIIIIPITRSALDTLDHRARLCGILQVMRAGVLITRTRIEMFAPDHVADFACVYTLDSRSLG